MHIQLRYYGIVADLIESKVDSVDLHHGATVRDLLDTLTGDSEDNAAILRQVSVFVDDKQANRATILQDGATVILMRPIAGGAGAPRPRPESTP